MDPEAFKSFADSFVAERNAIVTHQNAKFTAAKTDLARIKSRQKVLVKALVDGVPARTVKDEMVDLESREDELTAVLASKPSAEPSLHPSLAILYRERIAALHEVLEDPRSKDEAFHIIRTLIEEVRLVPEDGQLRVEM